MSDELGNVVCVTSTRAESRMQETALWRLRGERWEEVARWKGKMITAAAMCGGWVICAGLDGALYGVELGKGEVKQAKVEVESEFGAGIGAGGHRALFAGGAGVGLVSVEVPSMEVKKKALSEYGVSRPGRAVHAMAKWGKKVVMGGAKNLVYVYEDDRVEEIGGKASFGGGEVMVGGVAGVGAAVYATVTASARSKLFRRSGSAWEEVAPPTPPIDPSAWPIGTVEEKLLLAADAFYVRDGDAWRRWCEFPSGERPWAITSLAGEERLCVHSGERETYLVGQQRSVKLTGLKS